MIRTRVVNDTNTSQIYYDVRINCGFTLNSTSTWFENFVRKLSKKLLTISRNSTNFSLDWFVKRYNFNCWIVTGMVLSAPFLIWMSYMGPDERTSAVILLVTYWTVQSLNNSGFRVNHIDIAPRYLLQRVGFFLLLNSLEG